MKIDYRETTTDLLKRIDIHNQYGGRNIDEWMLNILNVLPNMNILDVACGAGKQCFSFYDTLNGKADITGVDVSDELLNQARLKLAVAIHLSISIWTSISRSPSRPIPLICFHAVSRFIIPKIYPLPSKNAPSSQKGGRLFTSRPMPANKRIFYDIIKMQLANPSRYQAVHVMM